MTFEPKREYQPNGKHPEHKGSLLSSSSLTQVTPCSGESRPAAHPCRTSCRRPCRTSSQGPSSRAGRAPHPDPQDENAHGGQRGGLGEGEKRIPRYNRKTGIFRNPISEAARTPRRKESSAVTAALSGKLRRATPIPYPTSHWTRQSPHTRISLGRSAGETRSPSTSG